MYTARFVRPGGASAAAAKEDDFRLRSARTLAAEPEGMPELEWLRRAEGVEISESPPGGQQIGKRCYSVAETMVVALSADLASPADTEARVLACSCDRGNSLSWSFRVGYRTFDALPEAAQGLRAAELKQVLTEAKRRCVTPRS